jgi:hypothetical protein
MSARAVGATSLTQQSENFGYSAVRLRRIVKIQFGIVNPTDLVRCILFLYTYFLGMCAVVVCASVFSDFWKDKHVAL